jgi:hypothetical protein
MNSNLTRKKYTRNLLQHFSAKKFVQETSNCQACVTVHTYSQTPSAMPGQTSITPLARATAYEVNLEQKLTDTMCVI